MPCSRTLPLEVHRIYPLLVRYSCGLCVSHALLTRLAIASVRIKTISTTRLKNFAKFLSVRRPVDVTVNISL